MGVSGVLSSLFKVGDRLVKELQEVGATIWGFCDLHHWDVLCLSGFADAGGVWRLGLWGIHQELDLALVHELEERVDVCCGWLGFRQGGGAVAGRGDIVHVGVEQDVVSDWVSLGNLDLGESVDALVQGLDLGLCLLYINLDVRVDLLKALRGFISDLGQSSGVVPDVLIVLGASGHRAVVVTGVVMPLMACLRGGFSGVACLRGGVSGALCSVVMSLMSVVVAFLELHRMNDLLLVHLGVQPGVVSAATNDDQICLLCLSHVHGRWGERVRIDVVTSDDRFDLDALVVSHGVDNVGPHLRGCHDGDGGRLGLRGVGGARRKAEGGATNRNGGGGSSEESRDSHNPIKQLLNILVKWWEGDDLRKWYRYRMEKRTTSRGTLASLAAELGVSRTTVSNAYNRPDQLSPALRARILATAERLGYSGPDPTARSLRTRRTGTVGVLFTDDLTYAFEDLASVDFLAGMAAASSGSQSALTLIPAGPNSSHDPQSLVGQAVVDGFVVYSVADNDPYLQAAMARKLPVVVVDQPTSTSVPWVGIDDFHAIAPAAQALLDAGHRDIGILSIRLDPEPNDGLVAPQRLASARMHVQRARVSGALEVLAAGGVDPRTVPVIERHINDRANNLDAVRELSERFPHLTAVLCTTDSLALAALDSRPDLSITGFDGISTALSRGLTTVIQPNREKGAAAGRMLATLIDAHVADAEVQVPNTVLETEFYSGTTVRRI